MKKVLRGLHWVINHWQCISNVCDSFVRVLVVSTSSMFVRYSFTYLLWQFRHVDRLNFSKSRKSLQSLLCLLLHGDDEGVLHVAVLRQLLGWKNKNQNFHKRRNFDLEVWKKEKKECKRYERIVWSLFGFSTFLFSQFL